MSHLIMICTVRQFSCFFLWFYFTAHQHKKASLGCVAPGESYGLIICKLAASFGCTLFVLIIVDIA